MSGSGRGYFRPPRRRHAWRAGRRSRRCPTQPTKRAERDDVSRAPTIEWLSSAFFSLPLLTLLPTEPAFVRHLGTPIIRFRPPNQAARLFARNRLGVASKLCGCGPLLSRWAG